MAKNDTHTVSFEEFTEGMSQKDLKELRESMELIAHAHEINERK